MSLRRTKIFLPVLRLLRQVSQSFVITLLVCVYLGKQERLIIRVADPGRGAFLTPGSGVGFFTRLFCCCFWIRDPVLRIRDFYPGSDFFPFRIPDPNCLHPGSGSRIRIKEFKYFNPKKKQKNGF